jgi:hypothetical protein
MASLASISSRACAIATAVGTASVAKGWEVIDNTKAVASTAIAKTGEIAVATKTKLTPACTAAKTYVIAKGTSIQKRVSPIFNSVVAFLSPYFASAKASLGKCCTAAKDFGSARIEAFRNRFGREIKIEDEAEGYEAVGSDSDVEVDLDVASSYSSDS